MTNLIKIRVVVTSGRAVPSLKIGVHRLDL